MRRRGMRAIVALVGAGLCASGCVRLLPDAGPPADVFQLTSPAQPVEAARLAAAPAALDQVIRIGEPATPQALDSDRLVIVNADAAMGFVADARWAETTPRLWQTALIERFEAAGRFRAAVRPEDGVRPDLDLRLDLRQFELEYDERFDAAPVARGRLSAKLVNAATRELLASKSFAAEAEAGDAKLAAMVQALDRVVDELARDIVAWTSAAAEPADEAAPAAPAKRRDTLKGGVE